MSTRSMIGHETPNGIEAIYCHASGYPEHHLPILTGHYATQTAVNALLRLGDLSSLGAKPGRKHGFDEHGKLAKNWCLAYGRDGGADSVAAETYASEDEFLAAAFGVWADYVYLFRAGRWLYRDLRNDRSWREVNA